MGRVIVFYAKADNKASGSSSIATRARDASVAAAKAAAASTAAQTAAAAAQSAAQTAAQTAATGMNTAAQQAAAGVGQGFKQGVYNARGWAAPRLESAADYVSSTAAPKVSSALRSTAQQVNPAPQRNRMRSAITWSIFGAAVVAALGAAAAVIRQRYQAAMAADTEVDEAGETPAPADGTKTDSAPGAGTGTDTGVNGRVSASGR
jgi:hypothetical protein